MSNTNPKAAQLRALIDRMSQCGTLVQLELIREALGVIADAMEPCEDCGAATIADADRPDVGTDPAPTAAQIEAAAALIDSEAAALAPGLTSSEG